ncbi:MAG: hypothetical protein JWP89_1276 [Schlesneria sp.]|nr:hypothetical protein [Schlesneria sp.]
MALTGNPEVPDETAGLTMTVSVQSLHPARMVFFVCSPMPRTSIACAGPGMCGELEDIRHTECAFYFGDDELEPFSVEGSYS